MDFVVGVTGKEAQTTQDPRCTHSGKKGHGPGRRPATARLGLRLANHAQFILVLISPNSCTISSLHLGFESRI